MFPCELQEEAARPTLSIRFRSPVSELSKHFGRIYGDIMHYIQSEDVSATGAPYAAYFNMDMNDMDIEAGIPVSRPLPPKDDIKPGEIPGGTFAVCHYTGPYDRIGPAYEDLTQFAQEQGYEPSGIAYEWYIGDPGETPPEELRTDISFPVKKIDRKETV